MPAHPSFTPFNRLRTGFDKLRANGAGIKFVGFFPFVLSLSKHAFVNCRVIGQFPESLSDIESLGH